MGGLEFRDEVVAVMGGLACHGCEKWQKVWEMFFEVVSLTHTGGIFVMSGSD